MIIRTKHLLIALFMITSLFAPHSSIGMETESSSNPFKSIMHDPQKCSEAATILNYRYLLMEAFFAFACNNAYSEKVLEWGNVIYEMHESIRQATEAAGQEVGECFEHADRIIANHQEPSYVNMAPILDAYCNVSDTFQRYLEIYVTIHEKCNELQKASVRQLKGHDTPFHNKALSLVRSVLKVYVPHVLQATRTSQRFYFFDKELFIKATQRIKDERSAYEIFYGTWNIAIQGLHEHHKKAKSSDRETTFEKLEEIKSLFKEIIDLGKIVVDNINLLDTTDQLFTDYFLHSYLSSHCSKELQAQWYGALTDALSSEHLTIKYGKNKGKSLPTEIFFTNQYLTATSVKKEKYAKVIKNIIDLNQELGWLLSLDYTCREHIKEKIAQEYNTTESLKTEVESLKTQLAKFAHDNTSKDIYEVLNAEYQRKKKELETKLSKGETLTDMLTKEAVDQFLYPHLPALKTIKEKIDHYDEDEKKLHNNCSSYIDSLNLSIPIDYSRTLMNFEGLLGSDFCEQKGFPEYTLYYFAELYHTLTDKDTNLLFPERSKQDIQTIKKTIKESIRTFRSPENKSSKSKASNKKGSKKKSKQKSSKSSTKPQKKIETKPAEKEEPEKVIKTPIARVFKPQMRTRSKKETIKLSWEEFQSSLEHVTNQFIPYAQICYTDPENTCVAFRNYRGYASNKSMMLILYNENQKKHYDARYTIAIDENKLPKMQDNQDTKWDKFHAFARTAEQYLSYGVITQTNEPLDKELNLRLEDHVYAICIRAKMAGKYYDPTRAMEQKDQTIRSTNGYIVYIVNKKDLTCFHRFFHRIKQ